VKSSRVDLSWLPVGAGGHVVRRTSGAYERLVARREHRRPVPLFHAALEVVSGGERFSIEVGPVWNVAAADRGVVLEGPVGSRGLARWRPFRYELRCWRDGVIPDLQEAVASPQRLSDDPLRAARLLAAVPEVPVLVWGRDELRLGEMWNSNSVVAWLLARSDHPTDLQPPQGGRAPGWHAGLVLAWLRGARAGTP